MGMQNKSNQVLIVRAGVVVKSTVNCKSQPPDTDDSSPKRLIDPLTKFKRLETMNKGKLITLKSLRDEKEEVKKNEEKEKINLLKPQ